MTWLDKLERRLGFLAVPGLLRYVAFFTALVYLLAKMTSPGQPVPESALVQTLQLDPTSIMHGQVWRLVTYIFIPQVGGMLPDWATVAFYVLFLWWMGNGLEATWGSFKLTIFYVIGMIGTTVAAFFFGVSVSNWMLALSLFFAFARFYPDLVIYFAYILPMKVKWVAWISAGFLLIQILLGSMQFRAAAISAMANYLIFFGPDLWREARNRRTVAARRQRFEMQARDTAAEALHRCATCGATELTNPHLEFRVARDGEEYCIPHLPRAQTAAPA
jgi:membrane associated rhomboid family serine protease